MAINIDYYGTVQEASTYFDNKLHEVAWSNAVPTDRPKALIAATRLIDALNFKGYKHTVQVLLDSNPDATSDEIREQEAAQVLEFPRGSDTEVPEAIRYACYEIAYSLLDGIDPTFELENIGLSSLGYESVRTTYHREQVPIEHIVNMIPSALAWRYLRPFLRDDEAVRLSRIS